MILSIDVSDPETVKLGLDKFKHEFKSLRISETLLPQIQQFLKKQKLTLKSLNKIEITRPAGHFSRIRTATAMANALAFGLNLNQEMTKPIYDRPPNITLKK